MLSAGGVPVNNGGDLQPFKSMGFILSRVGF